MVSGKKGRPLCLHPPVPGKQPKTPGSGACGMLAILTAFCPPTLSQLPGQQVNGPAESMSPLIQALVDDNVTLANMLLDAGADVATLDTITPLYAAQEYVGKRKARHAMLRKLLAAGAQVDQPTQDGTTTLMLAAYNGDVRSAQILLDAGADPLNAVNHVDANAIMAARTGGHHELAEQLREHVGESGARHHGSRQTEKVEL